MNMALSASQRPVVSEAFRWEPLPDGCALFHEGTGKLMTLNPPAEAVLAHCDGDANVEEIVTALEQEFGISSTDSRNALSQLLNEGVITLPGE